ncbi:GNAT family N-acetyltransferase [bacterium]|nr:GNAT family N-acetyltransferase [bacterium]
MLLKYRFATSHDGDALIELIERAYRAPGLPKRSIPSEADLFDGPRTSLGEVLDLIAEDESRFLVAEGTSGLIACALIRAPGASRGDAAYFGMFAIAPEHQAAGVGGAVLAEAERQARKIWGAAGMVMTVISLRTELIGWYARRGYLPTGRRLPFPFDEHTNARRTDFDLVELAKVF